MKRSLIFSLVVCAFNFASAGTLEKVTLADTATVAGKTLTLNGMGLRKVVKFGFPIKVYVGGLYLEKKSSDSKAIIASSESKRLVMQFLRSVDRDALIESFYKGYMDNCQAECDNKELFGEFKKALVNVRTDNQIILDFTADGFAVETTGPNALKMKFAQKALATNILSIFINEKSPPTPELRAGLLGQ